jgi:hypothetical protein
MSSRRVATDRRRVTVAQDFSPPPLPLPVKVVPALMIAVDSKVEDPGRGVLN